MDQFKIIAKTLHHLEPVLAREIEALGGSDIEIGRRMVSFVGDKAMLYKANLRLRTALRVLKPVYTFKANNPDELYDALKAFRWESIMTSRQTFAIDTVVYSESFTHSKYVGYRTKDAIVDYFRELTGERPSVRLDNPDIYLNIHISHSEVTLSLDSSGESLHKRGYRDIQTDAPINEVLAAGILLMAGWDGQCDLIDPMCGSGTFLVEAALIARNIAPGIYRQGFAFERWPDYDRALFEELYNDDSGEREFEHHIYGSDLLPHAIKVAQHNVARAGMSRYITLEVLPLQERPAPSSPALIVMNPPYGERLKLTSAEAVYSMIGERLKHNFAGCTAWIIAYHPDHFNSIGLRHSSRTELMNGALDCELRSYELFAGKRDDYKSRPRTPRGEHDASRPYHPRTEQGRERSPRSRTERPRRPDDDRRGRGADKPFRGERTPRDRQRAESEHRGGRERRVGRDHEENRGRRERASTQERKPSLWPSDRFRYTDAEGVERRRKPRSTAFQVFRSDEDK